MVTENYFRTLGLVPETGRFFLPEEDDAPGAVAVAVLSHSLWQSRFVFRGDVIGETVLLNRRAFTIVGVTPEGFRGTNLMDVPDVYVPMAMQAHLMPSSGLLLDRRGWGGINVVGLTRRGFDSDVKSHLIRAYKILFRSDRNTSQAIAAIRAEIPMTPEVERFVQFIESSERGII